MNRKPAISRDLREERYFKGPSEAIPNGLGLDVTEGHCLGETLQGIPRGDKLLPDETLVLDLQ